MYAVYFVYSSLKTKDKSEFWNKRWIFIFCLTSWFEDNTHWTIVYSPKTITAFFTLLHVHAMSGTPDTARNLEQPVYLFFYLYVFLQLLSPLSSNFFWANSLNCSMWTAVDMRLPTAVNREERWLQFCQESLMSYRFYLSFHEMVVQFSLAVWFHSFSGAPCCRV